MPMVVAVPGVLVVPADAAALGTLLPMLVILPLVIMIVIVVVLLVVVLLVGVCFISMCMVVVLVAAMVIMPVFGLRCCFSLLGRCHCAAVLPLNVEGGVDALRFFAKDGLDVYDSVLAGADLCRHSTS